MFSSPKNWAQQTELIVTSEIEWNRKNDKSWQFQLLPKSIDYDWSVMLANVTMLLGKYDQQRIQTGKVLNFQIWMHLELLCIISPDSTYFIKKNFSLVFSNWTLYIVPPFISR